jgi:hypothetical protein
MPIGIVPSLRPLVLPKSSAKETEGAQRAAKLADSADLRSTAAQAVSRSSEREPGAAGKRAGAEPAAVVLPDASLQVWDVNGDGKKDAVIRDASSGGKSALINQGSNQAPRLDGTAVRLSAPGGEDLKRLSVKGERTGQTFVAADLEGSGRRQLAVRQGEGWGSLGADNDGEHPSSSDGVDDTPIDHAEKRFETLVGELAWVVPAFAGTEPGQNTGTRRYAGFLQMRDTSISANPLMAFDTNEENLGQTVIIDSLGSNVSAFNPFGLGVNLYLEEDTSSEPEKDAPARSATHKRGPSGAA